MRQNGDGKSEPAVSAEEWRRLDEIQALIADTDSLLADVYCRLAARQQRLGSEIESILVRSAWDLYVKS